MNQLSSLLVKSSRAFAPLDDPPPVAPSAPIVFFAVGDTWTRSALATVSHDMGWRSIELASARDLLSEPKRSLPTCLVLEVLMPWSDEFQFHELLAAERPATPVVCVTGAADILLTVRAMKAGAVDVLPKPVQPDLLVNAVRNGLARSEARLRDAMSLCSLRESYASLSVRERQVMRLVVSGLMNKQAGGELGISEITVKAHRGRVMRKMNARTFADLVKMADKLELGSGTPHVDQAVPDGPLTDSSLISAFAWRRSVVSNPSVKRP